MQPADDDQFNGVAGEAVRRGRELLGLTQEAAARDLFQVDRSTVARWEAGEPPAQIPALLRLHRRLNESRQARGQRPVSLDELVYPHAVPPAVQRLEEQVRELQRLYAEHARRLEELERHG